MMPRRTPTLRKLPAVAPTGESKATSAGEMTRRGKRAENTVSPVGDSVMKQAELYDCIREWLVAEGFAAAVVGARLSMVIPVSDLVPMPYKVPDLVGVRDGRVAIVEVEQHLARFFDALGRCLLWKCIASFVYLAYPTSLVHRAPVLQRLGIGLLAVDSERRVVTTPIPLPLEGLDLHAVYELHPLDSEREHQLCRQIGSICA